MMCSAEEDPSANIRNRSEVAAGSLAESVPDLRPWGDIRKYRAPAWDDVRLALSLAHLCLLVLHKDFQCNLMCFVPPLSPWVADVRSTAWDGQAGTRPGRPWCPTVLWRVFGRACIASRDFDEYLLCLGKRGRIRHRQRPCQVPGSGASKQSRGTTLSSQNLTPSRQLAASCLCDIRGKPHGGRRPQFGVWRGQFGVPNLGSRPQIGIGTSYATSRLQRPSAT